MRILIIPAAAAALALAACGGSGGAETSGAAAASNEDKAFEGALDFARCMREQGIDFPDPVQTGEGRIRIAPGPGSGGGERPRLDQPEAEAAREKCQHPLQGGGRAVDPAERARMQDALLEYARCMRGEGIDMPDPQAGQGGVLFRAGEGGPNPDSPAFQAADDKCRPALAEVMGSVREERRP